MALYQLAVSWTVSRLLMTQTLMMMLMIPTMPGTQQPSISYMMSPANTVSCRDKDKRLLEEVESAQLAAHRYVDDFITSHYFYFTIMEVLFILHYD